MSVISFPQDISLLLPIFVLFLLFLKYLLTSLNKIIHIIYWNDLWGSSYIFYLIVKMCYCVIFGLLNAKMTQVIVDTSLMTDDHVRFPPSWAHNNKVKKPVAQSIIVMISWKEERVWWSVVCRWLLCACTWVVR